MSFYTPKEMESMLAEARRLGMRFPKGSESLPIETWCRVANGIGPGAWSRVARKISTFLQPFARVAAVLHDMGFCCPVKDRPHFNGFNDDFRYNIDRDIKDHTCKVSLVRFLATKGMWAEYQAVHLGGWDAYVTGETIPELNDTIEEGLETELRSLSVESTFEEGMEDSA